MLVQLIVGQHPTIPEYNQFPLHSSTLRMLISNGEYVLLSGKAYATIPKKTEMEKL